LWTSKKSFSKLVIMQQKRYITERLYAQRRLTMVIGKLLGSMLHKLGLTRVYMYSCMVGGWSETHVIGHFL